MMEKVIDLDAIRRRVAHSYSGRVQMMFDRADLLALLDEALGGLRWSLALIEELADSTPYGLREEAWESWHELHALVARFPAPSPHRRGEDVSKPRIDPDTFINAMDMLTERDEWRARALAAEAQLEAWHRVDEAFGPMDAEQWKRNARAATELGVEWHHKYDRVVAERDEARAEVERLSVLLRALVGNMNEHGTPNPTAAYYRSVDRARAALSPSPPDTEEH